MNLLNRLKPTENLDLIIEEVQELEQSSGMILPPVFKAFIINFELKSYYQNFSRKFLDEKDGSKYEIDGWSFKDNDEIGIESFLTPSEYLKATQNIYHYEEEQPLIKDKLVFANIFGGTLLVGFGKDNVESIYADFIAGDPEERVIKVATDIFQFFRKFEVFPMKDTLDRLDISEEGLYKNWGEGFWRFKQ